MNTYNMFSLRNKKNSFISVAPCENVSSGICQKRRPLSNCAYAQSDQSLHCPLAESLDTTECMNGEQRPRRYLAYAQDDLNLCILCLFERVFSLDAAQLELCLNMALS